ncbi:hypothetical protein GAYE_SCF08G3026 [Galdieria yellowstonensis]|uniref:Nuclease associated modular domain-containing protein n=1 Tax=Galdieria yellowstonensis TaxID=3028027 RepID=A0AAV9ICW2_9RHOD|nr:hypothetical protein GAYE_SCF08G3026 [Galdieria yellowstonensis]
MPFVFPSTQVFTRKFQLPCKRCCQVFYYPFSREYYKSMKLCRFYPVLVAAKKPNHVQENTSGELQDANSFFQSTNQAQNYSETRRNPFQREQLSTPLPNHNDRGRKKRKPHSLQTRKKISQSLRGRSLSMETRKKISDSMKGKQFSPSHRIAISERMQGPLNPMYGRRMSAQTRLKISLSLRKCKQHESRKNDSTLDDSVTSEEKKNDMQLDKTMLHEKYQQVRESLHLEVDREGLELIGQPSWMNLDEGKKRKLKMIQKSAKKRLRQVSRDIDNLEELDESFLVDDNVAQKLEPKIEKVNTDNNSFMDAVTTESNSQVDDTLVKPGKKGLMNTCSSCGGKGIKACEFCVKKYGVRSSKCIHCYGSGIMFCTVCNGSGELLSK